MVGSSDIREHEKIARAIEKTSESIRKKHHALKTGMIDDDIAVRTHLGPIIEPLQKIIDNSSTRAVKDVTVEVPHTPKREPDVGLEILRTPKREKNVIRSRVKRKLKYKRQRVKKRCKLNWVHWAKSSSRCSLNGNYKWVDALPRLVAEYNTRKHRTIGMRPENVWAEIVNSWNPAHERTKAALIAHAKDAWENLRRKPQFFQNLHDSINTHPSIVRHLRNDSLPVSVLEDYRGKSISGAFYEHELHRARYPDVYLVEKVLRRRGDKVYVKWLGFDGSHNSWIHKDNAV
ncbi:hypothetical protein X777_09194 [Ooceraea biroi]|uniref:Chromo domain-containing protein n=1 Tax=Ooceraea biroi TaxID=2015173 RepID=A0A026WAK2_OOCBI|nr:hypothetical protein X777_09194 [Ooceraea biroi]